ncbi:dehydrogenase subunit C-like protein [Rhodopirellula sp. SWK7]|uniref:dehydrogenase subunit C-like protein n=1 Tax=Rhodopirellula sp. SWK7 TaxID=595460 RepID=UPI0002C00485|nr:dehydrogenase subunit C-like protein [Rhodopirellula sp. SWK7]EMI40525.1 dehydrogenase, subunit C-like protein [Rhodopirellula sp. SWK7]
MNATDLPDHTFDLRELHSDELRTAIHAIEVSAPEDKSDSSSSSFGEEFPLVELSGLSGQKAACMRWSKSVRVRAVGDLGDFAFAWFDGVDVHLEGNVGDGACEGMRRGVVRITGNAGCGLGAAMTGGTLAIYGAAGPRVGAAMRGGSIFVRGDVGDDTGAGALAGTIVVGGDAGANLGDGLNNVTVFLRGNAQSLAPGVIEAPLRKREEVRLGLLLMSASIRGKAADFRRIIPEARWKAEEAGAGEVRPNWR